MLLRVRNEGSNNWAQLSCLFFWKGFILLWKFNITYLALSSGSRFVLIECCQGNDACGFSRCFGRDWRARSVCWWSYLGIRERHYVNLSHIKITLISITHVNLTGKRQFWAREALLPDFPTHHHRTAQNSSQKTNRSNHFACCVLWKSKSGLGQWPLKTTGEIWIASKEMHWHAWLHID